MSDNHVEWLQKQGVRIMDRRTLRRAHIAPYSVCASDDPINWTPIESITESVYQVELTEKLIERFEYNESAMAHAIDYVARKHGQKSYLNNNSYSEFHIDNSERHAALLKDNQMYRDAWKEFQSIRALLGETTTWP